MNGAVTATMLAPHETALTITSEPDDTGAVDVQLYWADPATTHGVCCGHIHAKLGPLVDNLHEQGCTVRGLDDDTRQALRQLAGGAR